MTDVARSGPATGGGNDGPSPFRDPAVDAFRRMAALLAEPLPSVARRLAYAERAVPPEPAQLAELGVNPFEGIVAPGHRAGEDGATRSAPSAPAAPHPTDGVGGRRGGSRAGAGTGPSGEAAPRRGREGPLSAWGRGALADLVAAAAPPRPGPAAEDRLTPRFRVAPAPDRAPGARRRGGGGALDGDVSGGPGQRGRATPDRSPSGPAPAPGGPSAGQGDALRGGRVPKAPEGVPPGGAAGSVGAPGVGGRADGSPGAGHRVEGAPAPRSGGATGLALLGQLAGRADAGPGGATAPRGPAGSHGPSERPGRSGTGSDAGTPLAEPPALRDLRAWGDPAPSDARCPRSGPVDVSGEVAPTNGAGAGAASDAGGAGGVGAAGAELDDRVVDVVSRTLAAQARRHGVDLA